MFLEADSPGAFGEAYTPTVSVPWTPNQDLCIEPGSTVTSHKAIL